MRIGEWRFRPRVGLLFLLVLPAVVCGGLGVWQLDRAAQKRALAAELAARAVAPAVEVGDAPLDPETTRYRSLVARGHFEADGQIYIENRHHAGKVGFHVITPLRVDGTERRLLVNRGWVPTMDAVVPDGVVAVRGVADVPSAPALVLHGSDDAARAWGARWPYLTLPLYAGVSTHPLQPVVLLQDPADPHGFERAWPREFPKEGMHIGYAIQWFAFALIALGIFLRFSLSRQPPRGEGA
jgi:surfeit locus 1 family protein